MYMTNDSIFMEGRSNALSDIKYDYIKWADLTPQGQGQGQYIKKHKIQYIHWTK